MTPNRPQLVFVWPYVEWGGAQIGCLAIIKLARLDWDVTVILPRHSQPDLISMIEEQGVKIEFMDAALDLQPARTLGRKLQRHRARIAAEFEAFRRLRSFPVSQTVFHIDFAPWQSWILFSALLLGGRSVFVTFHNFLPKLSLWREVVFRTRMQFLSRFKGFHVFTGNQDTRTKFRGWLSSALFEKVQVTSSSVDVPSIESIVREPITVEELRLKFGIPAGKFVVLTVGQFIDRKGRWVLLEAAQKAAQIDKDLMFLWMTPTMPNRSDNEMIDSFGLGEKFRLVLSSSLGAERTDVLRFFRAADCFVLPSFVEGLPFALLEAMALGLPSISTNVFAIPEAIKDGETGLLIEAGDSDELCKTILRMKNERDTASVLARNGRKFVLENFDERIMAQTAVRAFARTLEPR